MNSTSLENTWTVLVAIMLPIGIVGLTACSCTAVLDDVTESHDVQPTGEGFFESSGGWDYRRIPLIEPYQAVSADEGMWIMELKTNSRFQSSIINIEKLAVVNNGYIVSYSTNALLRGERVDELWAVVVPNEGIEMGFTDEHEFLAYLEGFGVDELNWADVDEVYTELVDEGYLEWFPEECKE